jgi:hypothetical protein
VHVTTALGRDDVEGCADDCGADRFEAVAVVRVDDELEGPGLGPARYLGVADRVVVAGFPGDQAGETLAPALHQVQPLVLTQGPVVVHRLGHVEEGGDGGDVAPPHLALDLHAGQGHGRKLPTARSLGTVGPRPADRPLVSRVGVGGQQLGPGRLLVERGGGGVARAADRLP